MIKMLLRQATLTGLASLPSSRSLTNLTSPPRLPLLSLPGTEKGEGRTDTVASERYLRAKFIGLLLLWWRQQTQDTLQSHEKR
jgi:hypothetical protein